MTGQQVDPDYTLCLSHLQPRTHVSMIYKTRTHGIVKDLTSENCQKKTEKPPLVVLPSEKIIKDITLIIKNSVNETLRVHGTIRGFYLHLCPRRTTKRSKYHWGNSLGRPLSWHFHLIIK